MNLQVNQFVKLGYGKKIYRSSTSNEAHYPFFAYYMEYQIINVYDIRIEVRITIEPTGSSGYLNKTDVIVVIPSQNFSLRPQYPNFPQGQINAQFVVGSLQKFTPNNQKYKILFQIKQNIIQDIRYCEVVFSKNNLEKNKMPKAAIQVDQDTWVRYTSENELVDIHNEPYQIQINVYNDLFAKCIYQSVIDFRTTEQILVTNSEENIQNRNITFRFNSEDEMSVHDTTPVKSIDYNQYYAEITKAELIKLMIRYEMKVPAFNSQLDKNLEKYLQSTNYHVFEVLDILFKIQDYLNMDQLKLSNTLWV